MEFGELLWVLSGLKVGVSVRFGERFFIVQSRWLIEARGGGVSHIVGISFIFALRRRFFFLLPVSFGSGGMFLSVFCISLYPCGVFLVRFFPSYVSSYVFQVVCNS